MGADRTMPICTLVPQFARLLSSLLLIRESKSKGINNHHIRSLYAYFYNPSFPSLSTSYILFNPEYNTNYTIAIIFCRTSTFYRQGFIP